MKRNYNFFKIIAILSFIISFPLILWLISFHLFSGYLCSLILLISMILILKINPSKVLIVYIVLFLIINILLFPNSLSTYNKRRNILFTTIKNGKELKFYEKFSIYGLNIIMSILGYPFYPEASIQTLFYV